MESLPSITTVDAPLENSPEEVELQSVSKPNIRGLPMYIEQEMEEQPTSIVTLNSPLENTPELQSVSKPNIRGLPMYIEQEMEEQPTSIVTLNSPLENTPVAILDIDTPSENTPKIPDEHVDELAKLDLKEEFPDNKLSILLIGRSGVGKSTLVNVLFNKKICPVSHGPFTTKHDLIERHFDTVFGVEVTIYDTRGLSDPECSSDKIIAETKKESQKEVDIVLICCSITERNEDEFGVKILNQLSKSFDENIWKKCILVLTKANLCEHVWMCNGDDLVKEIYKVMHLNIGAFHEHLKDNGVPDNIAINIPVCVAGSKNMKLPTVDDWVVELFFAFSKKCSPRARSTVMSLQKMRRMSMVSSAAIGSAVGAVTGAVVLPAVGAPIGLTVGMILGLAVGQRSYKNIESSIQSK